LIRITGGSSTDVAAGKANILKRKLQGSSPPKSRAKGGKTSEAEERILEADDHSAGEEAVFCEGQCQG